MATPLGVILDILRRRLNDINGLEYSDSDLMPYVRGAVNIIEGELNSGYVIDNDEITPTVSPTLQELFGLQSHIEYIKSQKTSADKKAKRYRIEGLDISRISMAKELGSTLASLYEEKKNMIWQMHYMRTTARLV